MKMAGKGADLVECLDGSYPGIRFLFTSAEDESGAVRQIGRSGRTRGFLQKNMDVELSDIDRDWILEVVGEQAELEPAA